MNICIPLVLHTERITQSQAFICFAVCVHALRRPFDFSRHAIFTLYLFRSVWPSPMYWCFPVCCGTFREKKPCAPMHMVRCCCRCRCSYFRTVITHTHAHTYRGLRFVTVAYAFNDSVEPIGTVRMRVCFVWNGITNFNHHRMESGTFFSAIWKFTMDFLWNCVFFLLILATQ